MPTEEFVLAERVDVQVTFQYMQTEQGKRALQVLPFEWLSVKKQMKWWSKYSHNLGAQSNKAFGGKKREN